MDSNFPLRSGMGVLLAAWGLAGCGGFPSSSEPVADEAAAVVVEPLPVPMPSVFPESDQPRLLAGQHWQTIAKDAARNLAGSLRRGQRCGAEMAPCRALFVATPQYVTEFSRAFVNALITALVQQGFHVSQAEEGALALHVDVQSVRFRENADNVKWIRTLAPGLWARAEKDEKRERATILPEARGEIIVTLSVLDDKRYAARGSTIYYVSSADLPLYEQEICSLNHPCPEQKLPPPRVAPVPLVGDPS
ncbi:MAG: hypothetical protein LBD68_03765 [Zoogloeaceae bacterium]|jgi:hypothetical protein|nr:hypothetical protein [Zoogloeaceae bacterium]